MEGCWYQFILGGQCYFGKPKWQYIGPAPNILFLTFVSDFNLLLRPNWLHGVHVGAGWLLRGHEFSCCNEDGMAVRVTFPCLCL